MAGLITAIDLKRKMYVEFEDAPFHMLEVEISRPTARGGQTLVRVKMRNLINRAVFDKTFKAQDKLKEPDLVMVPPLIFQPFVENSIWHGLLHKESGGGLEIRIGGTNELLECTIEDNGVGREHSISFRSKTSAPRKSLGLKLTKERLTLLNEHDHSGSSVEVVDLKDGDGNASGTKVILSISTINQFT